jgi:Sec-independent protein translocase protein TatA
MIAEIVGMDGIVVSVVTLDFGSNQLPKLARNIGTAGRELRKVQCKATSKGTPLEEGSSISRASKSRPGNANETRKPE